MVTTTVYNAANILSARPCQPILGNPGWADLRIESNRTLAAESVRGAGLYAIHYDKELIYVGQFRGTRNNAFAGNVCATRWAKHLGTLTLRDRRISFGPVTVDAMRTHRPPMSPLVDIVNVAAKEVIHKDRGRVSSLNRALFAAKNWEAFLRIVNAQGLAGFTITYTRIHAPRKPDHQLIRVAVEAAERQVIAGIGPRCNSNTSAGNAIDLSPQDTGSLFEETLKATLEQTHEALPSRKWSPTLPLPWRQVTPTEDLPDDDEPVTAEEAFMERLTSFPEAHNAVDHIVQAFDNIEDAYIRHTHTGGGDLRISSVVGPRPFFNVARIHWQPRCGRFKAEINLDIETCLRLGAITAVPNCGSQTLPTQATFHVPGCTEALIGCLCAAAEKQRNDFE
jgi:hypothetical protein